VAFHATGDTLTPPLELRSIRVLRDFTSLLPITHVFPPSVPDGSTVFCQMVYSLHCVELSPLVAPSLFHVLPPPLLSSSFRTIQRIAPVENSLPISCFFLRGALLTDTPMLPFLFSLFSLQQAPCDLGQLALVLVHPFSPADPA